MRCRLRARPSPTRAPLGHGRSSVTDEGPEVRLPPGPTGPGGTRGVRENSEDVPTRACQEPPGSQPRPPTSPLTQRKAFLVLGLAAPKQPEKLSDKGSGTRPRGRAGKGARSSNCAEFPLLCIPQTASRTGPRPSRFPSRYNFPVTEQSSEPGFRPTVPQLHPSLTGRIFISHFSRCFKSMTVPRPAAEGTRVSRLTSLQPRFPCSAASLACRPGLQGTRLGSSSDCCA